MNKRLIIVAAGVALFVSGCSGEGQESSAESAADGAAA